MDYPAKTCVFKLLNFLLELLCILTFGITLAYQSVMFL